MTRTIGVDQLPSGLDVAVIEWDESGGKNVLFGGRLGGPASMGPSLLAALVKTLDIQRGLIDPKPDEELARQVLARMPQVFSIEESAGAHNGASLAEIAYRRIVAMQGPLEIAADAPMQVASLRTDPNDPRRATVGVYVPAGMVAPTHAVIPLEGGYTLERPDGASVVEREVGLHEVGLVSGPHARVMGLSQVWTLAPTTQLPTRGWTFVLSLYALNGAKLIHEQALTEGQLLGLANVVPVSCAEASDWINRATWAAGLGALPAGPYTARFEIFAAQSSVHVQEAGAFTDPSLFAGALHDVGAGVAEWIETNAVDVEAMYPGVNILAPEPFAVPDITSDSYDYQV